MEYYGRSIDGADERLADYHGIRVQPDDVLLRPIDATGLHAPSRRSALRGAERDPLTAAFCSAIDDVVAASGAVLWILLWTSGPSV